LSKKRKKSQLGYSVIAYVDDYSGLPKIFSKFCDLRDNEKLKIEKAEEIFYYDA